MPEKQVPSKARDEEVGAGDEGVAVIYATFPSGETARALARQLVERGLAACVNIIPGMTAVYRWEGAIHEDREVVAVIKTRRSLGDAVVKAVCEGHPYANPAAMVVEVSGGSRAYLDWVITATGGEAGL